MKPILDPEDCLDLGWSLVGSEGGLGLNDLDRIIF